MRDSGRCAPVTRPPRRHFMFTATALVQSAAGAAGAAGSCKTALRRYRYGCHIRSSSTARPSRIGPRHAVRAVRVYKYRWMCFSPEVMVMLAFLSPAGAAAAAGAAEGFW
mmetsp:Transcript_10932/g.29639  ORF Transcript_10932/g.29639 Transcript_10932/m.29639 type:complete len:110 (-) Transcript_10932:701-1030(-)